MTCGSAASGPTRSFARSRRSVGGAAVDGRTGHRRASRARSASPRSWPRSLEPSRPCSRVFRSEAAPLWGAQRGGSRLARRPAMTWMDARIPAPPPALAERMRAALDAAPAGAPPADAALDAAMLLVDGILRDRSGSRTGAMALLAADALVTRAF